jgi:hypothetical protein
MKKFACILVIGILAISVMPFAQPWQEHSSFDTRALAIGFIESMVKGDFEKAAMNLDSTLKESLAPENLRSSWRCLTSQAGKFKKHVDVCTEMIHQYHIVILKCEFERCQSEIRVVFNKKGKIAGFTITPKRVFSRSDPD